MKFIELITKKAEKVIEEYKINSINNRCKNATKIIIQDLEDEVNNLESELSGINIDYETIPKNSEKQWMESFLEKSMRLDIAKKKLKIYKDKYEEYFSSK